MVNSSPEKSSAVPKDYICARKSFACPGRLRLLLLIALALFAVGCGGDISSPSTPAPFVHFVPNSHAFWSNPANWTTGCGPAYANILLAGSNFLPCRGGPFALCYYSGPSTGSQDLSCTVTPDGNYANCKCFDIPYGVYFVDINAILNHSVYEKTVAQCGSDGSLCAAVNSAPVCQSVNQGTLIPGAKLFSTFSFDCIPTNGIGQTSCTTAPYAGCMTAPCLPTDQPGIVNCSCPTFDGPYQIGQNEQMCTLGDDLVWSAAYAPPTSCAPPGDAPPRSTVTRSTSATSPETTTPSVEMPALEASAPPIPAAVPSTGGCVPDAPGGYGCPLYKAGTTVLPPMSGVDCQKVCAEYGTCLQPGSAQAGYTCDATLCTDTCSDRNLVGTACAALPKCDISEIVKAEGAAQCSCCASQLCNCSPDAETNRAIFSLNKRQRDLGITPQCDVNGTLCGTP
jgi:hypothetical protein